MPSLLLVDDEPHIIDALKRLFRREKYTLHYAYSAKEGLDILEQQHIDIILSDQRMPSMLGSEFLAKAQAHYPQTLRIILSGYADTKEIINGILNNHIHQFLEKPWRANELREHLRHLINIMHKNQHTQKNQSDHLYTRTAALSFSKNGTIKSINLYFCALLGQKPEQILSAPLTSVINYNQEQLEEILSYVNNHGHWQGKVTLTNSTQDHFMMTLAILKKAEDHEKHDGFIYGSLLTALSHNP
ncbi:response regulator [Piscirickettsia salmonis]|uniref:Hydrogenase transcriptional regulatory protein hupR1 n=2 Tax=Piscirickettsia salmonis TaxID=1238 RepID=A0A9Q5YHN0_PISSA|nr:response regulator [Piscirickettsia salmonis]ALA24545.1 response regulator [Piscirickettsia salmonis]APS44897.1 response regulator [Piscirickettsia salmonis]APS48258.1 response regulator [Piscirickettsia salmonis]APS49521.1 response regulator [Piscirickettsia salmonis]APS52700.1 response regulator [Piscirickettsia salmonis]